MKRNFGKVLTLVAGLVFLTAGSSRAAIIFDTSPRNDQANLAVAAGQTFTTGVLGLDNMLQSVEQWGPTSTSTGSLTYGMQLWTDTDQNPSTFDLNTLLATTPTQTIGVNATGVFDFSPFNISLANNTVYALRYVDGGGNALAVRVGLRGGNAGLGASAGSLFSGGVIPFNNGFDSAMRITTSTVPEPGSLMLVCSVAGLVIASRRRRV